MPFANGVVGGLTLVRPAIRSPNYVAGSTGWTINADGTAEFSNGTFRGNLIVGGVAPNARMEFVTGAAIPAELQTFYSNKVVSTILWYADATHYHYYAALSTTTSHGTTASAARGSVATGVVSAYDIYSVSGASIGGDIFYDNAYTSPNPADHTYSADVTMTMNGRLEIQTGGLLAAVIGTTVDFEGGITNYQGSAPFPFVPTVTGAGGATFTTRTGWYYNIDRMYMFNIYLVVNAPGAGATTVGISALPFTPDRSSRQFVSAHAEGAYVAGAISNGAFVVLTGGAGATIDRIRMSNGGAVNTDPNLTAAGLLAGAVINAQGWMNAV